MNAPHIYRAAALIGAATLTFGIAGCSSSDKSEGGGHSSGTGEGAALSVDLSFPYGTAQWNCIYDYGLKKGFYKEHGVAPTFDALKGSVALINQVAAGKVDIGTSAAVANVAQSVSKGAPVKLIAVQEHDSPNAVISLEKNPINKPSDLIGKKIAYSPNSLNGISFEMLLKQNHIPKSKVTVISVQPSAYASALQSGSIDGYVSYPTSSVPNQQSLGGKPVTMLLRDFGVNPQPADGYVTNKTMITKRPKVVSGFLAGARQTWRYLAQHPQDLKPAAQYCAKHHVGVKPETSVKQMTLALKINKKFISSYDFMSVDAAGLKQQLNLLYSAGQLDKVQPAKTYVDGTLLPKGK